MLIRRLCWLFFLAAAFSTVVVPSPAQVRAAPRAAFPLPVSQTTDDSRVGVSVVGPDSPLAGPLFTDAMKQASPWSSSGALHLDAYGNVVSLARGQVADSTIFSEAAYPSGDYTLLYDGTGTLEVAGATVLERSPGRALLRIAARSGGIHLRLSATAPNDPVRNIRLVLPGYAATYATQTFLPSAIGALRQFGVLRFEQWSHVASDASVESFPFRANTANVTQAGAAGVAPEYMIALANATGDDPWFVLPVGATDTYVAHFAQLVRATLNPQLHPIFQFGDDALAAGSATSAYAALAGLAERRASDPRTAAVLWHAARSVEVLDTLTLASAGGPPRPLRVLGLPSGAAPGAFEMRAAQAVLAAGAGHADAVAVPNALANAAAFGSLAAGAARARLALFASAFELQPALLSNSSNARSLYGAALERWHAGGGALAIVPSDATSELWAGAHDYVARHPVPHLPESAARAFTGAAMANPFRNDVDRAASNVRTLVANPRGIDINVGGPAVGSFVADTNSNQTGTYPEATTHAIDTNKVSSPAPTAVYQSARVGGPNLLYTVTGLTPAGTYNVRLDFADEFFSTKGSREFDIVINGATVQANYDIAGAVGPAFTAAAVSSVATANSSGQIVIALNATVNKALLSGIEVAATDPVPTLTPTETATPAPTPLPTSTTFVYTDTFDADPTGKLPAQWSVYPNSAAWQVFASSNAHTPTHQFGETSLGKADDTAWFTGTFASHVEVQMDFKATSATATPMDVYLPSTATLVAFFVKPYVSSDNLYYTFPVGNSQSVFSENVTVPGFRTLYIIGHTYGVKVLVENGNTFTMKVWDLAKTEPAYPKSVSVTSGHRITAMSAGLYTVKNGAFGVDDFSVAYNGGALPQIAGTEPTPAPTPTATPTPSGAALIDWPTYAYDNSRDGYNPSSTAITPSTVAKLHLAWYQHYNDYNTLTQPIVAANLGSHQASLFVGGVSGIIHSFDGLTGTEIWNRSFGQQSFSCGGGTLEFGIGGTQVYDPVHKLVYVTDDQNSTPNGPSQIFVEKLDAATGAALGSVNIAPAPLAGELNFSHAGLTLGANGYLYAGTGSTCDISSWRGRIAEVDPSSMKLVNTFYTTFGQGANYSGGGVWGWGGVAIDSTGTVYAGIGNADDNGTNKAPFVPAASEHAGYGEHLVQLSQDLSTVKASNYPGFTGAQDTDFAGTPVLFQPAGCPLFSASQGKGGKLIVYNTTAIAAGPVAQFQLSPSSDTSAYIGNPGYSPRTGLVYAAAASATGGALEPPGMVAIGQTGCGNFHIVWHTAFGPDAFAYAGTSEARSGPTATAGGVVFLGTACTPDAAGTNCTTPSGAAQGAVWALDAASGALLNGGAPILITSSPVKMAPVVDGDWVYVLDNGGHLYGLTLDAAQITNAKRRAMLLDERRPVRAEILH